MNIGNATDLTFSYYYLKQKDVTDYGQPALFTNAAGFFGFPPVSPENYYGYANHDFADYETHIGDVHARPSLQQHAELAQHAALRQLQARIGVDDRDALPRRRRTERRSRRRRRCRLLLVTRNHDSGRTRDNDDTAFINQTELTWRAATGTVRHTVLGGLELASERLDRRNYMLDANPAVAGAQAPTSTTPFSESRSVYGVVVYQDAQPRLCFEGRHRRGLRAGSDRAHPAMEGAGRVALRTLRL